MSSCVIYGSTEFTNLFFTGEGRGGDFVESNNHVEKKSKSKKLKSRYQSGIYSHVKRWVYLLFVCLLFIFIYYLITYWIKVIKLTWSD